MNGIDRDSPMTGAGTVSAGLVGGLGNLEANIHKESDNESENERGRMIENQNKDDENLPIRPHSARSSTPPPPEDNERDASSAMTIHRKKEEEVVIRSIAAAKFQESRVLDLREKALRRVPNELLELSQLEYLYLEGNQLTSLPDTFFDCLSQLQWLDLRRNYLASLPSTYIGSHLHLKTLLLEGNELKTLPLELGLIPTLKGLNICSNPLEFPPVEVIERGTQAVLQFMRDILHAKSQGKLDEETDAGLYTQFLTLDMSSAPQINNLRLDDSEGTSTSDDEWHGRPNSHQLDHVASGSQLQRHNSKDSRTGDSGQSDSDLFGPVPTSAALHQPTSYNEIKQKQLEKFRRAGALGTVEKKPNNAGLEEPNALSGDQVHGSIRRRTKRERRMMKVNMFPEPPPVDRVQQRFFEERHLHKLREIKEKQDFILQRRKDHEELRKWRQDGKLLQQDRYMEARMYGGAKDPVDIAAKAPFGIEKEHLKVLTNEERIAQAVKETHEKLMKRRAVSPRTRAKLDAERLIMDLDKQMGVARDRELERKIKAHMLSMQDRRRQPKGTPQEEMEISRRELEIANKLQAEVEARRKALEYRFTAFTGAP